ncbi:MAG: RDD family protein [Myxococcales bacterium]|nr:RDD family protein [Myxococcales bacterium]
MAVTAAPFWRRLLADLCDLALLGGVGFALWRSGLVRPTLPARAFDWIDYTAELLAEHLHLFKGPAVVMLGVAAIYAVVTRHLLAGTLGERLLGLRLIDREGEGAGPLRALAHAPGRWWGWGRCCSVMCGRRSIRGGRGSRSMSRARCWWWASRGRIDGDGGAASIALARRGSDVSLVRSTGGG